MGGKIKLIRWLDVASGFDPHSERLSSRLGINLNPVRSRASRFIASPRSQLLVVDIDVAAARRALGE